MKTDLKHMALSRGEKWESDRTDNLIRDEIGEKYGSQKGIIYGRLRLGNRNGIPNRGLDRQASELRATFFPHARKNLEFA